MKASRTQPSTPTDSLRTTAPQVNAAANSSNFDWAGVAAMSVMQATIGTKHVSVKATRAESDFGHLIAMTAVYDRVQPFNAASGSPATVGSPEEQP
jgi:hypothetical protein